MSNNNGILYIVATPIGHLADISIRALEVLSSVNLIAAEDTRNSKVLLKHHSIKTPMTAYHDHNEDKKRQVLINRLQEGESIALISDAGTPLINDPGYSLVRHVKQAGIQVVPIPGCCALIVALSAAGLATDRFSFEGFAPRTSGARKAMFESHRLEQKTLVLYESSHRILKCMEDIKAVYEPARLMSIARELTKTYETISTGSVDELYERVATDSNMQRGEFVVLIEGIDKKQQYEGLPKEALDTLKILLSECSLKTAVKLALELTGQPKKELYKAALKINDSD
ncbi:MAG: 16S rRNA (cytidine(1402)-2'-O)-methyltransferase [Cycloclasticus sp.]|nr:MAG: 16S rRNA (cytidine(1402)-2'-O)-methyltransferase [Cycloclasticus sp.]